MNIVLLAANQFGYRLCEKLIEWKYPPVGVFTSPRKFKISYSEKKVENILHRNLHNFENKNISVVDVKDNFNSKEYYYLLKEWNPDLIIAAGWYYMVPRQFREQAKFGALGIHHSLLPKYRGGAPLVWALINDEKKVGTTLFFLDDGVDSGDILAQSIFKVTDQDTIKTIYEGANKHAIRLLKEQIPLFGEEQITVDKQDESQATEFPQRKPADGKINWNWSAREIWNFTRAQTHPYPGAFTHSNRNEKIFIWEATLLDKDYSGPPGKVMEIKEDSAIVTCGEGAVCLLTVEREGNIGKSANNVLHSGEKLV